MRIDGGVHGYGGGSGFCIAGVWGHLFLGLNGQGKRKENA